MWRLVSYTHFWVLITRFQMSIIGSNAKCGQKQTRAACENCYVDVLYGWPLAVAATDANYSLQRKNNKNEEVIMESSSKCLLVIEVHLTNKQIRKFFSVPHTAIVPLDHEQKYIMKMLVYVKIQLLAALHQPLVYSLTGSELYVSP